MPPEVRFATPGPGEQVASGLGRVGQTNPITSGQGLVITVAVTAPVGNLPVVPGPAGISALPPNPNPNFPTFTFTYSLPLITPAGDEIPAGTNLAALFQFAGSAGRLDDGLAETTFVWFVGGSVPSDAARLTMRARIVDRFGTRSVGERSITRELVPIAGSNWTVAPVAADVGDLPVSRGGG